VNFWQIGGVNPLYQKKTAMTLKTYLPIAAALALVAACSGKKCDRVVCDNGQSCKEVVDNDDRRVTYVGVLPAADAAGIEYTLVLEYDGDDSDGDYVLTERPLGKGGNTLVTKGDFTYHKASHGSAGKPFLKLDPDGPGAARYFIVDSDNSITLTDASLRPAASGLNYTLTRK